MPIIAGFIWLAWMLMYWMIVLLFHATVWFCAVLYYGGKLVGEWGIFIGARAYDKWEAWRHSEEARRVA